MMNSKNTIQYDYQFCIFVFKYNLIEMNKINEALNYIQSKTNFRPLCGIILGTGLGKLAEDIKVELEISYTDIPNFPVSTVESHAGKLIFGILGGKNIVCMQGRFHYYEGYSMEEVVFPVRVMKLLGIEKLFISNAAGGLNPDMNVADLMIIKDHINLQPNNPLVGKNLDELGPRFPDMMKTYSEDLRAKGLEIAKNNNFNVHEGVYVSVPGPMLETPAEYHYLRVIGSDAVGMSTVPEAIAAKHMGLETFAISVITDMCTPDQLKEVELAHIFAAAAKAEPKMTKIITELIKISV